MNQKSSPTKFYQMITIYIIIVAIFVLAGANYCGRIFVSWLWMRKKRNFEINPGKRKFFIIIPILDETLRLPETVEYFIQNFCTKNSHQIILVTTEKEKDYFKEKTKKLVKKIDSIDNQDDLIKLAGSLLLENCDLKNCNLISAKGLLIKRVMERDDTIKCVDKLCKKFSPHIKSFHYPEPDGKMAHQINFAVKKINFFFKTEEDTIFAIYNADSRPDNKTFEYVDSFAPKDNNRFVFQQHGNYLKNYRQFSGININDSILTSAALWQTKWSLGIEMFNTLLQDPIKNYPKWLTKFVYPANYCVGHGLFITKEIYDKIGGLSETTYNEDAEFGLELSYFEIPILPIPFFDSSDSPNSTKSLYLQKSGWFFNPLQAFNYYKLIVGKYRHKKLDKVKLFIMAVKFFLYAVYWFLGPILFFVMLVVAFLNLHTFFWFLLLYIGYLLIPTTFAWILISNLDKRGIENTKDLNLLINIVIGSGLAYLIHGLSATKAIGSLVKKVFLGQEIAKNKTEMKI